MRDLDEFLADVQDVIEWSADAASWASDGSHEVETGGEYYGHDRPAEQSDEETGLVFNDHCPLCQADARREAERDPPVDFTGWRLVGVSINESGHLTMLFEEEEES